METVFLAINGDNVGDSIGQAVASDNTEELSRISGSVKDSHSKIDEWVKSVGGRIVATSGDEGVYQLPSDALQELESIRSQYSATSGHTLTAGVGSSISEASKALLYGKYNDKDQVVHYEPSIEDYINQDEEEGVPAEGELPSEGQVEEQGQIEEEAAVGIDEGSVPEHEQEMAPEENMIHDEMEQENDEVDGDIIEADEEAGVEDAQNNEGEYLKDSVGDSRYEEEEASVLNPEEAIEGIAGEESEMDGIDGDVDGQDPQAADNQEEMMEEEEGQQAGEEHKNLLTNMISGHMGEEEGMEAGQEMPMEEEGQMPMEAGEIPPEEGQEMPMEEEMMEEEGQMPEGQEMAPEEMMEEEGQEGSDDELKSDITSALMSFKQNKDMLEETKQSNPELYTATITMLRAMIEMSKKLGFTDITEEAPMEEGEEQMEEMEEEMPMEEGQEAPMEEDQIEEEGSPQVPSAEDEEEEEEEGK